jgi:EAL domain-containing protein (putative c-di-GMP-specific phosphodiesterase class I)
VKNLLEEYDFDPYLLHLEVTESVMLDNVSDKVAMFEALRKIGVKIELDDFGTGYTSLNYVRMIPLDVIKIDKCFIDDIGKSEEKEALISLIIGLAATYGASVVAEGVETAKQAEFLKTKGDVIIQGYYYSKPLELDALEERIRAINSEQVAVNS